MTGSGGVAIFSDEQLLHPPPFTESRLPRELALHDDGWRARLSLASADGGRLTSEFVSYDRNLGRFDSSFVLGPGNQARLEVRSFNELELCRYTGFVFTRGPAAIVGTSEWKGTTFGFLARPLPPYPLGPTCPGPITAVDFAGTFDLYCDGLHATVALSAPPDGASRTLTGVLVEDSGARHPLVAHRSDVPHHLRCTVPLPGGGAVVELWMFVRSRTVLAGRLDWQGSRFGCYLSRIDWEPGP